MSVKDVEFVDLQIMTVADLKKFSKIDLDTVHLDIVVTSEDVIQNARKRWRITESPGIPGLSLISSPTIMMPDISSSFGRFLRHQIAHTFDAILGIGGRSEARARYAERCGKSWWSFKRDGGNSTYVGDYSHEL
jgi:hypothetical protein